MAVFLLAFFLQIIFVFADTRDTPGKAAVEFARMYYQLDPAMSTRLCDELALDEENNVRGRLHSKHGKAGQGAGI